MNPKLLLQLAQQILPQTIQWRRALHQMPELGLELPKTVAYVCVVLDELGIEYDSHYIDGNGIVALIHGEQPSSKVLALRADMDGLPIEEDTGLDFASTSGAMHACGHDAHTAVLLSVAAILSQHRDQFAGTVKLIFQPGEEYPGGALPMIKGGALENPTVTRIYGMHQGQLDSQQTEGTIGLIEGPMMASMDRFLIEVQGKGYHGAYPELSHDPIVAAGQLIAALQTIKSRNISAFHPAILSITRVQGGFNQNIIPDNVELEGTVRTYSNQLREDIHHRIQGIADGVAQAFDVQCKVIYDYKYPAIINTPEAVEEAHQVLEEVLGEDALYTLPQPLMSSEDFAFYLEEVPGAFIYLSNPGYIEGQFHGHHHPKFDINEDYLELAIQTFLALTLDYLRTP